MAGNELYSRRELVDKFGLEEYLVFALLLLISTLIGVFFWFSSRKRATNAEFLLGSKSMGLLPVTLSLVASFMSAITLLGTPAETYLFGTQYCLLALTYPVIMSVAASVYLPVFYDIGVSTSYEYLEWRFAKSVRLLGAFAFVLQMVLYMAIVVYTPALALSQITGFDVDLACVIVFVVCIFYTSIGGIKAVVWTDAFQSLVMFGSFLAIIAKGDIDAGGSTRVFDINYQNSRFHFFDFRLSPLVRHSFWSVLIGGFFTWLSVFGVNQTMVQRYLSVPDFKRAKRAIKLSGIGVGLLLVICSYAGLVVFAYYQDAGCDPIASKQVSTKDQIFPMFVMQVMGDTPFVPGLFVAGVFSGALSTVSSGLNSLAAVAYQDFFQAGCGINFRPSVSTIVTKVLALVFGIISFAVIYVVKFLPGVLEAALAIFGLVGGPVLGTFTLGMLNPWANTWGAFVSTLLGFVLTFWIGIGQTISRKLGKFSAPKLNTTIENCPQEWFDDPAPSHAIKLEIDGWQHLDVYETSYLWFSLIGFAVPVILGSLFSLCGRQDPTKLNSHLISPAFKGIWGCLPRFIRKNFDPKTIGSQFVWSEKETELRGRQLIQDQKQLQGEIREMRSRTHDGHRNGNSHSNNYGSNGYDHRHRNGGERHQQYRNRAYFQEER